MLHIFCLRSYSSRVLRNCVKLLVFFSLAVIIYGILTMKQSKQSTVKCFPITIVEKILPNLPVAKFYGIEKEETKLDIVKKMLTDIGYQVSSSNTSHWELLWSYTYPFYRLKSEFLDLKHYQKVNHFPGSGYITQKNNLALLPVHQIPKSFLLPSNKRAFIQYADENKNMFWLIKNSDHRGIRLLNGTENLDTDGVLVQEFIQDPLLINGKKFDIGVYVILTSIDPLRVYMYSGDILLRFCSENYFPLNINNVASYVVGDDYLPVWEVPDLKFFYSELKYTTKESLNAYLRSKGKSTRRLWFQISQIIRDVYFAAEERLIQSSMALGSLRNYFELVRFDFVADASLNVFLLEVNMSPNLSPAHFPQNYLLYKQIVFDTLQITGLIRKFHNTFFYRGEAEVSERDILVNAEQCSSLTCQKSCHNPKCKVCNPCMNLELREILKMAHLEHGNRGKYRRLIPVPLIKGEEIKRQENLSLMNLFMDLWFKGKCLQDTSWCQ